jgi:hypothetical protein
MTLAPLDSIPIATLGPEDDEPFGSYHSDEGPYEVCWACHGFLVGPPGRRLCTCGEPDPIAPGSAGQAEAREDMADVLADALRRRWFCRLRSVMQDEEEARGLWDALHPIAERRAASRLAERGLA